MWRALCAAIGHVDFLVFKFFGWLYLGLVNTKLLGCSHSSSFDSSSVARCCWSGTMSRSAMELHPGCPDSFVLLHASQPLHVGQPLPVSASTLIDDSVAFNWPQPQGAALRSVVPCVRPAVDMRRRHRTHRLDIWVPESQSRLFSPSMSIVQHEPLSCFSGRLESQAQVAPLRHRLKGARTFPPH